MIYIQEIMGVNKKAPQVWLGKTDNSQAVYITFDHGVLTVRITSGGDPRAGLVLASDLIANCSLRQIPDGKMVTHLERNHNIRFAGMDGRRVQL